MGYISLREALIQNYHKHFEVITIDQVGAAVYYQWMGLLHAFYSASEKANKWFGITKDWESIDNVLQSKEYQDAYEIFKGVVALIGEVSGTTLIHEKDFLYFPLAACWKANKTEPETKKFDFFREICERSLGRRVAIQDLIGPQMMEEEIAEQRFIKKYKERRRRQKVRRAEAISGEIDPESKMQRIDFKTFIVLSNIFRCEKAHSIEPVRALIEILLPDGSTSTEEVSAGYCKECKKYFVFERDYKTIREKGVLLCRIIGENDYKQLYSTENSFSDLKPESVLHQCGYNVKAVDNLTTEQRQGILRRVIDNELYTINGVLNFLDWLIVCNKKSGKRDMTIAIAKWQLDREYVAQYQKDLQRKVRVDEINLKMKSTSKFKVGDIVHPKRMITYSNKQHMFEDDSGIVVEIKPWGIDDTSNTEEKCFVAVVKSSVTGEIFSAFEDDWIKA